MRYRNMRVLHTVHVGNGPIDACESTADRIPHLIVLSILTNEPLQSAARLHRSCSIGAGGTNVPTSVGHLDLYCKIYIPDGYWYQPNFSNEEQWIAWVHGCIQLVSMLVWPVYRCRYQPDIWENDARLIWYFILIQILIYDTHSTPIYPSNTGTNYWPSLWKNAMPWRSSLPYT